MAEVVTCGFEAHGAAVLAIFNEVIVSSTALYEYQERTLEQVRIWFTQKAESGFPVLAAVDEAGALLGFASYGMFRAWPAYKYSREHSVYVDRQARGQGVGVLLLQALIERARADGVHTLIGGIDAANGASISLHRRLGFEHAGTIRQAGFKFGRWLDLAFYQRVLETPEQPRDG